MGNVLSPKNDDIIASLALLRAYVQNKMAIKYQINTLTIRQNYYKSNLDIRLQTDCSKLVRISEKKLQTYFDSKKLFVKSFKGRLPCPPAIFNEIVSKQELFNTYDIENVYDLIGLEIDKLLTQRNRLEQAKSRLIDCLNTFKSYQIVIDHLSIRATNLTQLKIEILDLKHYISFCRTNNDLMHTRKRQFNRSKSLRRYTGNNNCKVIFPSILLLKNKLCMKTEAQHKISKSKSAIIKKYSKVKKNLREVYDRLHKKVILTTTERMEKESLQEMIEKIKDLKEIVKQWKQDKVFALEKSHI
ncbi:hypothetical protein SteCoe_5877 [Stentor coeruleus]|uniref:Uncharacterized protein n=1 Tax=Stentor coeruleus TaxID=5963 RepID=A0A1R2CR84_9CILI|nr:hypothetical protein SteCoe_5877 [Stentor coeruleus]